MTFSASVGPTLYPIDERACSSLLMAREDGPPSASPPPLWPGGGAEPRRPDVQPVTGYLYPKRAGIGDVLGVG
jgi:hypothetical protein